MKKRITTKTGLISAVLALIIVFTALLGTTWAWFTDSASSDLNKIISGKLDVGMNYWNAQAGAYLDASNVPLFDEEALWEPGYVEVAYLEIENRGNLSFNYLFAVYPSEEVEGYLKNGKTFRLSDYLVYAIVEYDVEKLGEIASRDQALSLIASSNMGLTEENLQYGTMHPESEAVRLALIVYMPTYVTSEQANHDLASGKPAPSVKLAVDVYATQNTHELDSFDDQYDAGLTPVWAKPIWRFAPDGYTVDAENKKITVNTTQALKYLGQLYDDMVSHPQYTPEEWEIVLGSDLDFGGEILTEPIRFGGFKSFNGNNKTIYNVILNYIYVDEELVSVGLFDKLPSAKDLTLSNITVTSTTTAAGALAGTLTGDSYSNITVADSGISGVGYIGSMIGYGKFLYPIDFSGIQIFRTDLSLFGDNKGAAGGIAGYIGGSNVTVSNSTVNGLDTSGVTVAGSYVGGLFGELDADAIIDLSTVTEITIYKDVYIGSITGKIYDEKVVKVTDSTVAVQAYTQGGTYIVIPLTDAGEIADSDISVDALGFPQSALHTTYDGHYYQAVEKSGTWQAANDACIAMNGHLATLTSAGENAAIAEIVGNHGDSAWLGAYRTSATTKGFSWVTGEEFDFATGWWAGGSSPWESGEPNSTSTSWNSGEPFLGMYGGGKWNDFGVGSGRGNNLGAYVCEWDSLQSYLNYLTAQVN